MVRFIGIFLLAFFLLVPFVQAGEIKRAERDLIAIVNVSLLKKFKPLYENEERRAVMKIKRDLGHSYRKIHFYTGKSAGHDSFLRAIAETEADPSVKATDVIVYLHGQPGEIGFVDTGFYPMPRLRDEILALPSPNGPSPQKLRALYSDACYGASDMADWLRAGFRVVTGARGSDTNFSYDLNKFMNAWREGKTFGYAIDRANSVAITRLTDWIEKGDSFKETDGEVGFTLSQPLE